jgi:hypothetical protein
MKQNGAKFSGASILTVLGVVCLGTFLIAAFTWSTQSTQSRGPQEVFLGTPTENGWDAHSFFNSNTLYTIKLPVTYNFHGEPQISYSLIVEAVVGEGTIEMADFIIDLDGIAGATLSETSAGRWTTGKITVENSTLENEIILTIGPTTSAMDLDDVSFTISAISAS